MVPAKAFILAQRISGIEAASVVAPEVVADYNALRQGPSHSWSSLHTAPNCTAPGLQQVGGAGKIYRFTID